MKKLKNIKQKHINTSIVILTIIAIALGVVIYLKDSPDNQQTENVPANQQQPTQSFENANIEDMTQEELEQRALQTPGRDSSEEDRRAHFEIAQAASESGTEIEIEDCSADPVVLETQEGDEITINNIGDSNHTLLFGPDNAIDIEAGGSTNLSTSNEIFSNGPGLYGYGCDDRAGAQGLIIITPAN